MKVWTLKHSKAARDSETRHRKTPKATRLEPARNSYSRYSHIHGTRTVRTPEASCGLLGSPKAPSQRAVIGKLYSPDNSVAILNPECFEDLRLLQLYPSIHPSIHPSIYLYIYIYVFIYMYLFIFIFISIYLLILGFP